MENLTVGCLKVLDQIEQNSGGFLNHRQTNQGYSECTVKLTLCFSVVAELEPVELKLFFDLELETKLFFK